MHKKVNFIRFILPVLLVISFAGVLFAEGGDDDKKNNKDQTEDNINKDSTDRNGRKLDYDVSEQSDDTLVFEDWESPEDWGDGGTNSGSVQYILSGKPNKLAATTGSQMIESGINSISEAFKRNYKVEFNIFPNPTVQRLQIKPSIEPNAIRIADISGKQHLQMPYVSEVNVSNLPAGTYFIQLIYLDHIEARKFIKS